MSRVVELLYSRRAPQMAVLAFVSVGFSACSADMQTRFQQAPFGPVETTGSVQRPQQQQQRYSEQRELPQYARPQYQAAQPHYQSQALPPISTPSSYPVAGGGSGMSGGGRGVGSYEPPARAPIEATGTVPVRSVAAARPAPAPAPAPVPASGTTIIVGTSDTLEGLSRRYNVSTADILHANGYKGPRRLQPGQSLVIPSRTATLQAPAAAPPVARPVASAPAPVAAATPPRVHYVNSGDTLMNIARRNNISLSELARANRLDTNTRLKPGMKINVPGSRATAAAPPAAAPAPVAAAPVAAPPVRMAAAAPADPVQKARLVSPTETPAAAEPAEASPVKAAEATGALPSFRWPVRGRVITAYGAKTNGKSNDGINLAVPEGTPIKAAEDGVVAYSGNELKGYGNLVLVRHSNGYVTAYAHASELMVKRGETIKRGQTIAKSGQTGEVGSPQLHFEIRKGSSPVDPLKFLNGA
ncbi:peptidoglycan DD-metalloendopeptidase family protein [Rhodopseudomonas palustris]|uniref:peptidoglycan DD-metalloendopeptidase family protein n=1 Tax=Rhodopseudomonas palustris TaxID=1076 RepID=UPI002ACE1F5E|nr:peptidoglycan DD-metalloendopeptidase family protein [Rhodopseudomonas palustris]WQH00835.1 peptidoglycan DD-metalloendopeptidase family protein [Rhodopseudomonas palustris]